MNTKRKNSALACFCVFLACFAFIAASCKRSSPAAPSVSDDLSPIDIDPPPVHNYVTPASDFVYTTNNDEITIVDFLDETAPRVVIPETIDGFPVTIIANTAFLSNAIMDSITGPSILQIDAGGGAHPASYGAFSRCLALTNVSFSNATNIGANAFQSCLNLTAISFPNAITIGQNAFSYCSSLTNATFPEATTIGLRAFSSCSKLVSANFAKAAWIGDSAFSSCVLLTTIVFPEATTIRESAFSSCNFPVASFPEASTIGEYAFSGCQNLTNALFPKAATIGGGAFYSCSSLISTTFPEAATISENAFFSCPSLTDAVFLKVTTIGSGAFRHCSNLAHFTIEQTMPPTVNDTSFADSASTKRLYVPSGFENNYNIWKTKHGFEEILSIQ